MKKIILFVAMVCFQWQMVDAQVAFTIGNPNESLTNDSIDKVQFIAQYKLLFVTDPSKSDNITDETMMLKVGTKSSIFYSYTKFITDSIFSEGIRKNNGYFNMDHGNSNPGRITYQILKNYPAGRVTTLDRIASSSFRCEEENETPEWELLEETDTILSYPCQKARCNFKGRDFEAWFTIEIPTSEGPWKLHGLPGLILKAEDSEKHYVFECTGIEQVKDNQALIYTGGKFEPVSRKNLNKIHERFAKDPIGYITASNPNMKIVVKNESGESFKPKDQPYNPIERSE